MDIVLVNVLFVKFFFVYWIFGKIYFVFEVIIDVLKEEV